VEFIKIPKVDFSSLEWPKFDLTLINWSKMPKLKLGDLTAKIPIIQGGMGINVSLSGLASAVANEGGIGVIAANSIGMLDPDYYAHNRDANAKALRREIKKANEKTSGIIGVNIMVAVADFHDLIDVAIEEKVDIIFLGAGLPIKGIPVKRLREANVKVVPIVSSGRAAGLIFRSWAKRYNDVPDGVVVEGPKAGGHLGFKKEQIDDPDFSLESILPDVVSAIKTFETQFKKSIPIIAAGGIFTGVDIHNIFKLGASGVQMATRFVATHECDADIKFKEAYISCKEEDLMIIKSPVGMPGRAIRNDFLLDSSQRKLKCAWKCLSSCDIKTARYCISLALDNARQGDFDDGFVFAGSNAHRVNKIVSVKEIIQELKYQYLEVEEKEAGSLRVEYENTLDKLRTLKDRYSAVLKENYNLLKDECEISLEKGTATVKEEYYKLEEDIVSLKGEYSEVVEKATQLKEELIQLFENYSLVNKQQPALV